ncbi:MULTISPECIES: DUF3644 domain-containing protein [unclassified Shewanella]|uniref:DUF3644 domain-containing protein n=1 Tax=Shewanella TaxID=22 RepID=UPI001BB02BD2|nr:MULTISPECIES: DUF3644 domain-containing protein [unclassified Shewanella]MBS0040923.1 DUF3644 domain-containing protein [Shewanella sp. M16]MBW3513618.1 DUF3644 domain-containing protein [Shewanella sp. NKUCC01_JLK]MCU8005574.1 DUF3644 domain-containing protein [Shewanella sp. SM96]MCU8020731.1 DUF3644 domain-containing protein [Shewanella sp. SM78]MCU8028794.1 DUF3644 domain-containing protein [Shewanella sp. SM73]
MAGRQSQRKFFNFLQHAEHSGKSFSREELIVASGWKVSTFETYYNKGQITQFVTETGDGIFRAINTLDLTFVEFQKRLSQSKHFQELGHKCKSQLSKALLKKSRDNMMLALELYNRPSLENKLDGFVLLFCTAWEQLSKARLIERDGEDSIFEPANKKGIRQTISLRACLARLYADKDLVRKNIEMVADWRDQAVHLLMPELQAIASRIFQSGVLNFSSEFEAFSQVAFISVQHTGMMTIVGDFKLPAMSLLKTQYGAAAYEILELATSIQYEVEKADDMNFAIPLKVHLVFAQGEGDAQVVLTKASGTASDLNELRQKLKVIEKTIDLDKSHPYSQTKLQQLVNTKLETDRDQLKLEKCIPGRNKFTGRPELNNHCIQACIQRLAWQQSNNEYHYHAKLANRHQYSESAVTELVKRITQEDDFVAKAKKMLSKKK